MTYIPLHDSLVVALVKNEEKTASGIIIPGSTQEKPSVGTVLAVGKGRVLDSGALIAPSVQVGDKVAFKSFAFSAIPGEEGVGVISESDVLVIMK
ncbi:co-chaperone GroES [Candidatus Falkowbacteria bacterium]|nr:co-chaperone GroES [Candidatus Falkowbacteria bacterium]